MFVNDLMKSTTFETWKIRDEMLHEFDVSVSIDVLTNDWHSITYYTWLNRMAVCNKKSTPIYKRTVDWEDYNGNKVDIELITLLDEKLKKQLKKELKADFYNHLNIPLPSIRTISKRWTVWKYILDWFF